MGHVKVGMSTVYRYLTCQFAGAWLLAESTSCNFKDTKKF